ncbi:hypothetical protein CXF46_04495 [Corynebacterium bovis]|nr:hypothetical protein CXF29_09775 [Corynebacterium bovis]RRQ15924.1 hypothetical protein CXF46_04495 [Corynebacterium bovis]
MAAPQVPVPSRSGSSLRLPEVSSWEVSSNLTILRSEPSQHVALFHRVSGWGRPRLSTPGCMRSFTTTGSGYAPACSHACRWRSLRQSSSVSPATEADRARARISR